MPYYKAFELVFKSDLVIPELLEVPESEEFDVEIREGRLFDIEISKQNLHYTFPKVGLEFWVNQGIEIIYYNSQNIDRETIAVCIMDFPLVGLLYQHDFIVLHGSSIVFKKDFAIGIIGFSGAGKSTTTALLHEKGYAILGDEICAIKFDENNIPFVYPSYPGLGLWESSFEFLRDNKLMKKGRLRKGMDKYDCNIDYGYYNVKVELRSIFYLEVSNLPNFSCDTITEFKGIDFLQTIRENSLSYFSSIEKYGFIERYFLQCSTLCSKINLYRVVRCNNNKKFTPVPDIIENFLRNSS